MTFSPTAHDGPRRRTHPPHPSPYAIAIFWLNQRCFGAPATRPMSWSNDAPQSQVPKLGIDVGDVLSVKNVRNAEGAWLECMPRATKGVINDVNYTSCLHSGLLSHLRGPNCWLSMSEGAYPFLVLFIGQYGSNAVHVISRTERGSWQSKHRGMTIEHYVIRFLRQCGIMQLGMEDCQITICAHKSGWLGKGIQAKKAGITHMIDNDPLCLWSVLMDKKGCAYDTISSYDDGGRAPGACFQFYKHEDTAFPTWLTPDELGRYGNVLRVDSWMEVADYFDLPHRDKIWWKLMMRGPPYAPAPQMTAGELINECLDEVTREGVPGSMWQPVGPPGNAADEAHAEPWTDEWYAGQYTGQWPDDHSAQSAADDGTGSPHTGSPRPTLGGGGSPPLSIDPGSAASSRQINVAMTEQQEQIKQLNETVQSMHATLLQVSGQAASAAMFAHGASEAVQALASQCSRPLNTPMEPVPEQPPWAHWQQRHTQAAPWLNRKAARAQRYRAMQAGEYPPPEATTMPPPPMCRMCGKNQPGRHCISQACKGCCFNSRRHGSDWRVCWQHDDY